MSTLYVENVPEELYEALRARAGQRRKSISAEVLELLAENVPTADEMARRRRVLERVRALRPRRAGGSGPFPTTERMQREDRRR